MSELCRGIVQCKDYFGVWWAIRCNKPAAWTISNNKLAVCDSCKEVEVSIYLRDNPQKSICFYNKIEPEPSVITFNKFSELNKKRCESPRPNGFNENIKEFGADHWLKAFNEEVGEINGAILGMSGKKERKKHLTREDALDEIGDAVACLDLLAQSLDSTLGECAIRKFNKISDRIGSNIKID